MKLLVILFGAVALPLAAQTPACRLTTEGAEQVRTTIAVALANWPSDAGRLPFAQAVVNRAPSNAQDLAVEIVTDVPAGRADPRGCAMAFQIADRQNGPDEVSVKGVCTAVLTPQAMMRCSGGALSALIRSERNRNRPSPALLYVISHELGHIAERKIGQFSGAGILVNLAATHEAKWRQLTSACRSNDQSVRAAEDRADAIALGVLAKALGANGYRDPLLSARASLYMQVHSIRVAADALSTSEQTWVRKAAWPKLWEEPKLPGSPDYVAWATDRLLCDVLDAKRGQAIVPVFQSDHADDAVRLFTISDRIRQRAGQLTPAEQAELPAEIVRDLGNFDALVSSVGDISSVLDRELKEYRDALGRSICQTRINPDQQPNCPAVSTNPPLEAPDCAQLDASFMKEPLTPHPASSTAKIVDGALQISADVTSVWPLANHSILIGMTSPPRLAVWDGAARIITYDLPYSPGAIGSAPSGAAILCDQPFGYVLVKNAAPVEFYRMSSGAYDGEPVTSDQLRAQWIGSIGERLFASFRIPAAGKSANFEISGLRAVSPSAWKQRGCEKVHTGMTLWPTAKSFVGASRSTLASPEVAALTSDLARIEKVADPPSDTLGCGFIFGADELVCVLSSGSIVRPLDQRQRAQRIIPPAAIKTSQPTSARLCGSAGSIYVLFSWSSPGGSGSELDVFSQKSPTPLKRWTTSETEGDLACSPAGGASIQRSGENAFVRILYNQKPMADEPRETEQQAYEMLAGVSASGRT